MSEVAEAPQVKNTTSNESVRSRMVDSANANRAAIVEKRAEASAEAKPEIKVDTVAQAAATTEVKTEVTDSASAQAEADNKIAQNNAIIEAEKKAAQTAAATATAETEAKLKQEAPKEKEWYEQSDDVAPAPKSQEIVNAEIEAKLKVLEELENDEFIKGYMTTKKSGKDITSFIKEVAPLDVDSIPDEKLYELSLQKAGLTLEDQQPEMEAFESYTPLQKKRAVAEIKEELRKEDSAKLAKYNLDNKVDQAKQQQFMDKYKADKSEFLSKLKEKEDYMGLKLDQTDIENALNYVENGFPTTKEDGSYNLPTMFELAVFRNKKKEISQNLINKGISLGREAVLKELARTDRNDGAGRVLPDVTSNTKADQAKEIMRKKYGQA